jgi:hypothetical protein
MDPAQPLDEVFRDQAGMITGPAGDDLHRPGPLENTGCLRSEGLLQNAPAGDPFLECLGDSPRLLMDLLLHVMTVLSPLHRVGDQLALFHRPVDVTILAIVDIDPHARDARRIAFLQEHESPGDRQQGRHIRGDETLADTEPDHHRASLSGNDHAIRVRVRHDGKGICALQPGHGPLHRLQQTVGAGEFGADQVGHHLGIRFGTESGPGRLEFRPQRFEIFDDAIVDDGQILTSHMGMRIALAGNAVGRPASVRDAAEPGQWFRIERILKPVNLALGPLPLDLAICGKYGDTGRVVAAVFKSPQPLHQDGDNVALRDCSYDPAHLRVPPARQRDISSRRPVGRR